MAANFDPYREWLGIQPQDQPAHYYRLLGISTFESDANEIAAAAERTQSAIQAHADGPHTAAATRLSAEVSFARRCLLDAEWRAIYDAQLRAAQAAPPGEKRPHKIKGPPKLPRRAGKVSPREIGLPLDSAPIQHEPLIPLDGELPANINPKVSARDALAAARHIPAPPPPPTWSNGVAASAPPRNFTADSANHLSDPSGLSEPAAPSDSMALRALVGFDAEATAPSAAPAKATTKVADVNSATDVNARPTWTAGKAVGWGLVGGGVAALLVIGVVANLTKSSAHDSQLRVADSRKAPTNDDRHSTDSEATSEANAGGKDATSSEDAIAASNARKPSPVARAAPAITIDPPIEKLLKDAQETGEVEPVKTALDAGLDIETRDSSGRSLLRLAVMGNHRDLVEMLIDKNAQVNTADWLGETPLMSAAQRGDAKMVSLLLSSGASPDLSTQANDQTLAGGFTALHLAAHNGHTEVIATLLEEHANPNLADGAGVTPLMLACKIGAKDAAEVLLQKDARPDGADYHGQTPLMYAVSNGNKELVTLLLLNEEVLVSDRSANGATAISIATAKGDTAIVQQLREALKREAPKLNF
jgi:ankyrin repeat protein